MLQLGVIADDFTGARFMLAALAIAVWSFYKGTVTLWRGMAQSLPRETVAYRPRMWILIFNL